MASEAAADLDASSRTGTEATDTILGTVGSRLTDFLSTLAPGMETTAVPVGPSEASTSSSSSTMASLGSPSSSESAPLALAATRSRGATAGAAIPPSGARGGGCHPSGPLPESPGRRPKVLLTAPVPCARPPEPRTPTRPRSGRTSPGSDRGGTELTGREKKLMPKNVPKLIKISLRMGKLHDSYCYIYLGLSSTIGKILDWGYYC